MAEDQLQQELAAMRARLDLVFYAQAEILLRLTHPELGEPSTEDIHRQQLALQRAHQNRPGEHFRKPEDRLLD